MLPITNELGYYEIRLESIGGLGANVAGKILAEAGVVGSGLNALILQVMALKRRVHL